MDANFKYDEFNVPWLNNDGIEEYAAKVLDWFDKASLVQPVPIDILGIYNKLADKKLLIFGYESLNAPDSERTVFGRFVYGNPPKIILDKEHDQEHSNERVRFTMAHELGHYVLHRHRKIENEDTLIDDKKTLSRLVSQKKGKEWAEWQANYFAGSLLLPSISLKRKLIEVQVKLKIPVRKGLIYINDDRQSNHDFTSTLSELSNFYAVSRKCVEIRLKQLNLLKGNFVYWEKEVGGLSYEDIFASSE